MRVGPILKVLAFVAVLIACMVIGIVGLTTERYELLALLPFGLFGGITGIMYARSAHPTGSFDPPGTGGKFMGLPDWVTIVDFVLLGVGILVIVVARSL